MLFVFDLFKPDSVSTDFKDIKSVMYLVFAILDKSVVSSANCQIFKTMSFSIKINSKTFDERIVSYSS